MNEDIKELLGKTIVNITNQDEEILFTLDNGDKYKMYHPQDCCESVYIESITGDFSDLIGSPLTLASERSQDDDEDQNGIGLWTFYAFATMKGYVDIRWYGSSNGYYGVSVYIEKV